MKRFVMLLCTVLGAYCLVFGIIPLFYAVFNFGVAALLGLGVLLLALPRLWEYPFAVPGQVRVRRQLHEVSDRRRPAIPLWWKRLRALLAAGLLATGLVGGICSFWMVRAAWFNPPQGDCTVVVLGCQVRKDGTPSLMLRYRLDAAYRYLAAHPDAPVICTGGLDDGRTVTEAGSAKNELVSRGIDPSRIYTEDRSRNTEQNLAFSKEIIAQNGLPSRAAIATDGFHQKRGAVYAQRAGFTPYALPAVTPWGLLPSYWVREWGGLLKAALFTL